MAKRKPFPRGTPPAPKMHAKLARRKPLTPLPAPFPVKGNESRDYRGEKNGQRV